MQGDWVVVRDAHGLAVERGDMSTQQIQERLRVGFSVGNLCLFSRLCLSVTDVAHLNMNGYRVEYSRLCASWAVIKNGIVKGNKNEDLAYSEEFGSE